MPLPKPGQIEEFLWQDPDSGMIICMIADGDGFRPAHASDEVASLRFYDPLMDKAQAEPKEPVLVDSSDISSSIDEFIEQYDRSFNA